MPQSPPSGLSFVGSSRNLVAIIQDAGFFEAWAPTSSEQKGTPGKHEITEG